MGDIKTNLVLEAKAKGLDKLASIEKSIVSQVKGFFNLKKASKDAEEGIGKYKKTIGGLEDKLKSLAKAQLSVMKEMDKTSKASKSYGELTNKLKELEAQQRKVEKQAQLTTRAYSDQAKKAKEAQQASGSFTQGLLQGGVPGASYLQRGPGMFRQAAGAAIGSRARQGIGGMGAAPFTGMQGIATALSAIPGGGLAAGALQNAVGLAGQSLSSQQMRMQLAPYLGAENFSAQGNKAAMSVQAPKGGFKSQREIDTLAQKAGISASPAEIAKMQLKELGRSPGLLTPLLPLMAAKGELSGDKMRSRVAGEARSGLMAPEREFLKKRAEASIKAEAKARSEYRAPLKAGARMGYDINEMMQMGGQISQRAGGNIMQEESGRQMLPFAAAAQRAYGVDSGVSGAFLMGQRRGGVTGGPAGAEGMTKAIGDAVALGLTGSELTDYMQQMADGIMGWKTTGIALDTRSVGAMGLVVAKAGMGGLQGARVAQGLQGAGKQLAAGGGPQSAEQMAIFQDLYGFQGGGLEEYKNSMMAAEEGTMQAGGFAKLMDRLSQSGGGGAGGVLATKNVFSRLGTNLSIRDIELMMKKSRIDKGSQEQLTEGEQKTFAKIDEDLQVAMGKKPKAQKDIIAKGKGYTPDQVARQKEITNRQLNIGDTMITASQDLATQAATMAATVTLFSPEITKLTGGVSEAATVFENFVARMRKTGLGGMFESSVEVGQ